MPIVTLDIKVARNAHTLHSVIIGNWTLQPQLIQHGRHYIKIIFDTSSSDKVYNRHCVVRLFISFYWYYNFYCNCSLFCEEILQRVYRSHIIWDLISSSLTLCQACVGRNLQRTNWISSPHHTPLDNKNK